MIANIWIDDMKIKLLCLCLLLGSSSIAFAGENDVELQSLDEKSKLIEVDGHEQSSFIVRHKKGIAIFIGGILVGGSMVGAYNMIDSAIENRNPRILGLPSQRPCAKLCADLANKLSKAPEDIWIWREITQLDSNGYGCDRVNCSNPTIDLKEEDFWRDTNFTVSSDDLFEGCNEFDDGGPELPYCGVEYPPYHDMPELLDDED